MSGGLARLSRNRTGATFPVGAAPCIVPTVANDTAKALADLGKLQLGQIAVGKTLGPQPLHKFAHVTGVTVAGEDVRPFDN